MLIVGDKEKEAGTISLRARKEGNVGVVKLGEFVERVRQELR